MVEAIYFLKPAWCGNHPAGLRPEEDLQSVIGATAFQALVCHLSGIRTYTLKAGSANGELLLCRGPLLELSVPCRHDDKKHAASGGAEQVRAGSGTSDSGPVVRDCVTSGLTESVKASRNLMLVPGSTHLRFRAPGPLEPRRRRLFAAPPPANTFSTNGVSGKTNPLMLCVGETVQSGLGMGENAVLYDSERGGEMANALAEL